MLTFEEMGIARDDPSLSPSGVGSTRYAFRQTFPIGGKRGLAREIAEAGAEQAAARERLSRVELRSLVKFAFNEYQYAHAAIRVTEELRALVDELESIAQARYRVRACAATGRDQGSDRAHQSAERAADAGTRPTRHGGAVERHLGAPANSPLAEPAGWPALPASVPTLAELQARIFGGNPQLAGAQCTNSRGPAC